MAKINISNQRLVGHSKAPGCFDEPKQIPVSEAESCMLTRNCLSQIAMVAIHGEKEIRLSLSHQASLSKTSPQLPQPLQPADSEFNPAVIPLRKERDVGLYNNSASSAPYQLAINVTSMIISMMVGCLAEEVGRNRALSCKTSQTSRLCLLT